MDKSTLAAIAVAFILSILLIAVAMMLIPGHYIYVPEGASTVIPKATPMDVILRMRDADGKNEQTWVCKFEAQAGWVCEPGEDSDE